LEAFELTEVKLLDLLKTERFLGDSLGKYGKMMKNENHPFWDLPIESYWLAFWRRGQK